jgi:hypothetical protein
MFWRKKSGYEVVEGGTISLDNAEIPLSFRHNARARRLILRTDPKTGGAIVTLPPGVSYQSARDFAEDRADWLRSRLARTSPVIEFRDGAVVPYMGVDHDIVHREKQRGTVICEDGVLFISGRPEHLARRLTDWFKAQARREISQRAGDKSSLLNQKHGRISIRDTKSRWGSCSHTGALNFSWRLILAPHWVLDYVVAHEVAHLVEHNHSPRFWHQVGLISDDVDRANAWLKHHGQQLHQYGKT